MSDDPLPIYVIGSHGCSPENFGRDEQSTDYPSSRYFIVPDDKYVIYFNNNGVESEGFKNIPFIKNLYDYNKELFYYIIDPHNYFINLDKNNPASYRHQNFFKSLPFFSNFNYLCNIEIYPPGVHCPIVNLSFSSPELHAREFSYFEGITPLQNIIYNNFGERLAFVSPDKIINPYADIAKFEGFINTNNLINDLLLKKYRINKGIFFISACRANFFKNNESDKMELVDIHPISRNCGDLSYDISIIDELKKKYPMSSTSLDGVKARTLRREEIKKKIDGVIASKFLQNTSFYINNYYDKLFELINIESGIYYAFINFVKIKLDCNIDHSELFLSRKNLLDNKFLELRKYLKNRPRNNIENNNVEMYKNVDYLYKLIFFYFVKYSSLPSYAVYYDFLVIVKSKVNSRPTEEINKDINNEIFPKYDFFFKGGSYEYKYNKYKTKYLLLKNKQ